MILKRFFIVGWILTSLLPMGSLFGQASTGAPLISTISDQVVFPGTSSRPIPFVVSDDTTPAYNLAVKVVSSNPSLTPSAGLVLGGAGSNHTLTITPAQGLTGPAVIGVVVTDTNALSTTNFFNLDVSYFTPVESGLPAFSDVRASWADYDNDGFQDLSLNGYAGFDLPAARLYHNNGNGTFTDANAGLSVRYRNETFWGDYNRDGYLDLALTGSTNSLYRNNGDGSFTEVAAGLPCISTGAIAWGDYDNDGDLDAVTSGSETNGSTTRLMRNNGDGTFTDALANLAPMYNGSAEWGDYDNDGDLDLLLTGYYSTFVTKLFKNNNGVFTEVPAGLIGVYLSTGHWGDYDNDGDLDILLTGGNGDYKPTSRVYRNDGNDVFTDINAGLKGVHMSSSAWGDFDNDGFLDVIVSGQSTNWAFTGLYRNNRDHTFTLVPAGLTNVQSGSVCWVDFDRDNDLDLLVAGYTVNWGSPVLQLYRNNAPTNTPPTAPAPFMPELRPNGDVVLNWSVATDAQTPPEGLTYNLRIGTSPGGNEVFTSQADALTGVRRVTEFTGMHLNSWPLRGLPKGTYYWAVQALDSAMVGSPFSAEQTFTITNTPPRIDIVKEVRLGPSSPGTIPFTLTDDESSAAQVSVTATSTNDAFVPTASLVVSGTGASRTLSFTIAPGQLGTNYLTLRATDPNGLYAEVQLAVVSELFTSIPFPASTNFYELSALRIGPGFPTASSVLDIDEDGDMDFLMRGSVMSNNYSIPVIVVASNGGVGDFTFNVASNLSIANNSVWLEDFDRDGHVDLLSTGDNSSSGVFLHSGDGSGGFGPSRYVGPGLLSMFADMDNDGDLDSLELSSDPSRLNYYQNVNGLLRPQAGPPLLSFTTYQESSAARVEDIDADGDMDIMIPGEGSNSTQRLVIRMLRNPGRGPFGFELLPVLGSATVYNVFSYDADDDRDMDVQFLYSTNYSGIVISGYAANDGTGHFSLGNTNRLVPSSLGWDFDDDGDIDRVVNDRLYLKATIGQWSPLPFTMTPPQIVADFDGDGDLDYMARSEEKDTWGRITSPMQWRLFRNNTDRTNSAPNAPSGLIATQQQDDRVTFTWNPAQDDHTPTNWVTYNLRVGSTPGGVDVITPCANPVTGERWISRSGNVDALRFHDLRGLPPGTYYWSVQAIDGVFAASAWAPEQSFTISRPTIAPIADIVTPPGVTSQPIRFSVTGGASPVSSLTITVVPDDPTLIPPSGIVLAGTGSERSFTVNPANRSGDTELTITATDASGFSAIVRCHVRVAYWDTRSLAQEGIQRFENWNWADVDLDGDLDLFGYTPVGTSQPELFSYRNLGNAAFEVASNNLPGWSSNPIKLAGFAGDNTPDVLTLQRPDSSSSLFQIWQGTGAGFEFQPLTEVSNRSYVANHEWVDLDNDGLQDVVHFGWATPAPSNAPANSLLIARGKANGTFEYMPQRIGMYSGSAVATADFDLDGDFDLVVSGQDYAANGRDAGPYFIRVYSNQGHGNFTANTAGLPQIPSYKFSVVDFDGDTWPDLLLSPINGTASLVPRLMRNVAGTFVEVSTTLPPQLNVEAWADYDNDGDLDLVGVTSADYPPTGGTDPYLATLFRNDQGVLTRADTGLPWIIAHQASFADADNDGDLDLLISGETGWNRTGRFLCVNTSPRTNTPPSAPINLSSATDSARDLQLLQWAPVPDAESGSALTYNLRVGTTPGGFEVMSAVADPTSGHRALTGSGNIGNAPRWQLALPDGRYFWSVQAIDSGFAASAFAPEASFTYFHPTISGASNLFLFPTALPPVIQLAIGDEDSGVDTLGLTAYSSNTNLLAESSIVFAGSGSIRTATLNFSYGMVGTSVVSIVVTDVTGLTATNTFRIESAYLTDITSSTLGSNYFAVRAADFDNDNDFDIYSGGTMYRNIGNTALTVAGSVVAGGSKQVAWSDYNCDGNLDFVSGGGAIYRNLGGGVLSNINASIQALYWGANAWGDYNNDGRPDLLVTGSLQSNANGPTTVLYRNDGNDQFTSITGTGLPAIRNSSLAWGDYNNDGRLDILINGLGGGPLDWFADIYRNNGDGTFTGIGAGFTGGADGDVDFGDYDNDGSLDVLVTGFNLGTYVLHIYHNNRNGTFTEMLPALTGVQYGTAQWGDFDNDGLLDIMASGCTANYCDYNMTTIYRNRGNGTFANINAGLPYSGQGGSWADFDNDGDLDLWFSFLYRNNSPVPNSPPSPPSGLAVQLLPDNNVSLAWQRSSDSQNGTALSYALRVGTSPGGIDYVSPDADLATGFRRLPRRGPISTNSAFLRNVPRGTYYWSVQAVDGAFAGSAFAAEGSFVITNARPLISAISNQLTVPGRATPPISFSISDLETPATDLVVTAVSLDTTLVPTNGIVFAGATAERTITLTPAPGRSGTATIIVSVADPAGLVASSRFDLVIQTFTEQTTPFSSVNASCVSAWGDYDKDGWMDIVLSANQQNYSRIYRNTGGSFSMSVSNLPLRSDIDLAWVDYDNDNDLDLAYQGWSGGYSPVFYLHRNNGTNSFTTLTGLTITNLADGALAWGDYDNDGDQDVLVTGDPDTYHSPNGFSALFQNNRGVFTQVKTPFPPIVKGAVAWGDVDNDGDLDLIMSGQTTNLVTSALTKFYRNDGSNIFTEVPTSLPPATRSAIALGDYDNDGLLDIALAGMGTNSVSFTRIYHNGGPKGFSQHPSVLPGVADASLAWGDYDNDGRLDLAVCGTGATGPTTRLIHNDNFATFTDTGSALLGVVGSISWADYDHDGDLDLLGGSRLYRNNYNVTNYAPTIPSLRPATVRGFNEVEFAWQRSSDPQTSAAGISYNLRVGTTPGGTDIISPNADATNGVRRIAAIGNVGSVPSWRVLNLTNGTYYWSLQAIDTSFAGSAFAPEQVVTVSRPVISAITNLTTPPNMTVGPITFTVSDPETAAANLTVSATSSDTNLVPSANIVLSGTSDVRALTITPTPDRSGTVRITVIATDESGQQGAQSFLLTVERFAEVFSRPANESGPVAWGDYDGDGRLDLILRNIVYHNNGNGQFSSATNVSSPVEGSANWGDYDGDSDLDLVTTGSNAARILRNEGNGSFTNIAAGLSAPSSFGSSAWGDIDNDGDLDVIIVGSTTKVYRNNLNRTFTDIGAGLPVCIGGSAAWGDCDNDGDLDLLLSGNAQFKVYRNNGTGVFTEISADLNGLYNSSAVWGDFNNDGYVDFAVVGSTNNAVSGAVTRIYKCNYSVAGGPTFTNIYPVAAQGPIGIWKGAAAWGDYDNDGDLDLLISGQATNSAYVTKLYRNDNGSFVDSGYSFPGQTTAFAAWGDFDNDRSLDFVLSGPSFTKVFRNVTDGPTNSLPSAPGALSLTVLAHRSIRLNWQGSTDPNQSSGLTYNVRVGSTPDSNDVLPSMATVDGVRLLPNRGNAGSRLSVTLTNVPGGTLYWSVQAVDSSFAGSLFSTQISLTLPNVPPTVSNTSVTIPEDSSTNLVLAGTDSDGDPLLFRIIAPPMFGTLTGTPPALVYRPFPNYFGSDQFTFLANDRVADSEPATISISVQPIDDVPGATLGIQALTNGNIQLGLKVEPWRTWQVQFSEDLIQWDPLTNIFTTNMLLNFTDSNACLFDRRFYRVSPVSSGP